MQWLSSLASCCYYAEETSVFDLGLFSLFRNCGNHIDPRLTHNYFKITLQWLTSEKCAWHLTCSSGLISLEGLRLPQIALNWQSSSHNKQYFDIIELGSLPKRKQYFQSFLEMSPHQWSLPGPRAGMVAHGVTQPALPWRPWYVCSTSAWWRGMDL